jgi:putative heme-binding domain-containing protein
MKGDVGLGEQLFTRQTCVACHTTSQDQPQKGPYLGNIAQTYKRPDLAENILDPNKTIAQGFATNIFTLKDGSQNLGFVTRESADEVTIRNVAAQEFTYKVKDIAKRDTLPTSLMPIGLVNNLTVKEFASLLDYLESLAKK